MQPVEYTLLISAPDLSTVRQSINIAADADLDIGDVPMMTGTAGYTQSEMDQAVPAAVWDERSRWDVNGDGKIGLEEAVHALQQVTGQ